MPIVTQCTTPGCETLTIGPRCVEHDFVRPRVFVRGRPWSRSSAALALAPDPVGLPTLDVALDVRRASERPVAARALR
jgi:hypothetical protein